MIARPYEWSDLEIFLATARGGTLAAAAKALRVDTSTVQRRIGKLETAMRTKLFLRSPRGYSLTESGQDVYHHALAMDEQASGAWRKVVARDEQPMGTIRLATVDDFAVHVLPPIIASFRAKQPNVTVFVDVRSTFVDLAKHEADVALRLGTKSAQPPDVVVRRVASPGFGLYASRDYVKAFGRPKHVKELERHSLVRAHEALARAPFERFFDEHSVRSRVAMRANSFFARAAAIGAGVGIGFVPFFLAATDRRLVRLRLPLPPMTDGADVLIVVHADLRKNARVRAFVDHLDAALGAQRARFEEPS